MKLNFTSIFEKYAKATQKLMKACETISNIDDVEIAETPKKLV